MTNVFKTKIESVLKLRTEEVQKEINEKLFEQTEKLTQKLYDEIKENIPNNSGNAAEHLHKKVELYRNKNGTQGDVYFDSDAFYMTFVNLGTTEREHNKSGKSVGSVKTNPFMRVAREKIAGLVSGMFKDLI